MKNNYEVRGDVTAIIINSPKYGRFETLISTNKLDRVKEFPNSWFVVYSKFTKSFYVYGNSPLVKTKRHTVALHRWITNVQDGLIVDHFNHDTLNNTDKNLREVTVVENGQNRKGAHKNNHIGVRGVYWHKKDKKWRAKMKVNYKEIYIGSFDTIGEAETAVIEARKIYMPFSQEAYKNA